MCQTVDPTWAIGVMIDRTDANRSARLFGVVL